MKFGRDGLWIGKIISTKFRQKLICLSPQKLQSLREWSLTWFLWEIPPWCIIVLCLLRACYLLVLVFSKSLSCTVYLGASSLHIFSIRLIKIWKMIKKKLINLSEKMKSKSRDMVKYYLSHVHFGKYMFSIINIFVKKNSSLSPKEKIYIEEIQK